jgi:hypothetical protein
VVLEDAARRGARAGRTGPWWDGLVATCQRVLAQRWATGRETDHSWRQLDGREQQQLVDSR